MAPVEHFVNLPAALQLIFDPVFNDSNFFRGHLFYNSLDLIQKAKKIKHFLLAKLVTSTTLPMGK